MDCYKEMYYRLFNKITDITRELQAIQTETEKIYLSGECGSSDAVHPNEENKVKD